MYTTHSSIFRKLQDWPLVQTPALTFTHTYTQIKVNLLKLMKADGHNAYDREPMGYWAKQCLQEIHILISVDVSLQEMELGSWIFVDNNPKSRGTFGINKEFLWENRQRVSYRRQEGNVTI